MIFKVENKETYYTPNGILLNRLETPFKPFFFEVEYECIFNLPKGVYRVVKGGFTESLTGLNYFVDLPEVERSDKHPESVKYAFGDVRFKAMIYRGQAKIFLDKKYFNYPQYVAKFLLEHEKAHYFYETERYCDLWAANKMLKLGYNPTQIFDAIDLILGNKQSDLAQNRIDYIYKKLNTDELRQSYFYQ